MVQWLPNDTIALVHRTALDLKLPREGLIASLPRPIQGVLPHGNGDSNQIFLDLHYLNQEPTLPDGTLLLWSWLKNAESLAGPRSDASIFRDALYRLSTSPQPSVQLPYAVPTAVPPPSPQKTKYATGPARDSYSYVYSIILFLALLMGGLTLGAAALLMRAQSIQVRTDGLEGLAQRRDGEHPDKPMGRVSDDEPVYSSHVVIPEQSPRLKQGNRSAMTMKEVTSGHRSQIRSPKHKFASHKKRNRVGSPPTAGVATPFISITEIAEHAKLSGLRKKLTECKEQHGDYIEHYSAGFIVSSNGTIDEISPRSASAWNSSGLNHCFSKNLREMHLTPRTRDTAFILHVDCDPISREMCNVRFSNWGVPPRNGDLASAS